MKVYPENKKHDLCVISIENQFLVSFSLDPALYYATPRHNPRSDFKKNDLKSSARLEEKKVMKFQRKKITTGWDITKNVEGVDSTPGPFRVKIVSITCPFLYLYTPAHPPSTAPTHTPHSPQPHSRKSYLPMALYSSHPTRGRFH